MNEFVNMPFVAGQRTRRISNKSASDYLADIVVKQGKPALQSQCVPYDPELWKIERYRDFVSLRRAALADQRNEFIRKKAGLRLKI